MIVTEVLGRAMQQDKEIKVIKIWLKEMPLFEDDVILYRGTDRLLGNPNSW